MDGDLARAPRLLIPDTSPLSLLSMAGRDALDYLFVPRIEVWITDMVAIEATRDPDPDDDPRTEQRKLLAAWFGDNRHRVKVMETAVGREYEKAMTNWRMGGGTPDLKPSWTGRGDYSLLDVLAAAETVVEDSETVVLLVDDRRARAALRQTENLNLDILSTRSFIAMLETEFGVENATDIWTIIEIAAGVNEQGKSKVPDPLPEDPLYVRKP
ncbi:hypothetical protein [Rhizobium metallidurans]|uniref:DUF4935 domain-containing protein n=1 Tax=Rhizobium metallidurans TaxID=1265931 RepID=A0A7W6GDF3_9HYPH|nr:hypothetical protein [Rhizobium metallidurans]MBB3966804.1 hypothetical protein [Rhizobium metallidurans]